MISKVNNLIRQVRVQKKNKLRATLARSLKIKITDQAGNMTSQKSLRS